uniref:CRIC domain-containing protein n=1 Tax=Heterorhabditis bacteriophora TaxID=37862 RepID=A0A1I7XAY5_HETBA
MDLIGYWQHALKCHEAPSENLQSLAMKVVVACKCVSREMFDAVRMRKKVNLLPYHYLKYIIYYSSTNCYIHIDAYILNVYRQVLFQKILYAFRSPFDEIEHYVEIRNRISRSILELVRNINVQPKAFFGVAYEIMKQSNELKEQCEDVIRGSDDSALLYTTYMERVLLRRHDKETNWVRQCPKILTQAIMVLSF